MIWLLHVGVVVMKVAILKARLGVYIVVDACVRVGRIREVPQGLENGLVRPLTLLRQVKGLMCTGGPPHHSATHGAEQLWWL